jgi:hypothetical protein
MSVERHQASHLPTLPEGSGQGCTSVCAVWTTKVFGAWWGLNPICPGGCHGLRQVNPGHHPSRLGPTACKVPSDRLHEKPQVGIRIVEEAPIRCSPVAGHRPVQGGCFFFFSFFLFSFFLPAQPQSCGKLLHPVLLPTQQASLSAPSLASKATSPTQPGKGWLDPNQPNRRTVGSHPESIPSVQPSRSPNHLAKHVANHLAKPQHPGFPRGPPPWY